MSSFSTVQLQQHARSILLSHFERPMLQNRMVHAVTLSVVTHHSKATSALRYLKRGPFAGQFQNFSLTSSTKGLGTSID